jgi:hypothetical protein
MFSSSFIHARLKKDIAALGQRIGINCGYDGAASVAIDFSIFDENRPNRFLVTVPHFYPHTPPVVCCLEAGFQSQYINESGRVVHEFLGHDWSALCSLNDVIDILVAVRQCYGGIVSSVSAEISSESQQISGAMEAQIDEPFFDGGT